MIMDLHEPNESYIAPKLIKSPKVVKKLLVEFHFNCEPTQNGKYRVKTKCVLFGYRLVHRCCSYKWWIFQGFFSFTFTLMNYELNIHSGPSNALMNTVYSASVTMQKGTKYGGTSIECFSELLGFFEQIQVWHPTPRP
jgi:hypothetical protein